MNDQTKTSALKLTCLECKNDTQLKEGQNPGDVVECEFCGIEYEITGTEDGEYSLQLLEEEK